MRPVQQDSSKDKPNSTPSKMGRTEPSIGRPPAGFRRDARAKKAKATINQVIPPLLQTHPKAQRGIDAAELILDPPATAQQLPATNGEEVAGCGGPRITLRVADTLTTAHSLVHGPKSQIGSGRVAILNMASPLSPGGGFVNGATSQEESLCMRTTLLPSLRNDYYRLPELSAVYTPDVLVFRDEHGDKVLAKNDRWFVDCITAAMLRGPETERDELERGRYVNDSDRELALRKMKIVLRICEMKGIRKVVLGAWGCGAYGNPVGEIASCWRKALLPKQGGKGKKKKQVRESYLSSLEEVVFAIKDAGMARAFEEAFGKEISREEPDDSGDDGSRSREMDPSEVKRQELQEKIQELELRIKGSSNPQMKKGLQGILAGLVAQLPSTANLDVEDTSDGDEEAEEDGEDDEDDEEEEEEDEEGEEGSSEAESEEDGSEGESEEEMEESGEESIGGSQDKRSCGAKRQ